MFVSVYLGVITYDQTRYRTRLRDGEFATLSKPYPPEGAERKYLRTLYRDWTPDTRDEIAVNSDLFSGTQLALLVGITLLSTGGIVLVVPNGVVKSVVGTGAGLLPLPSVLSILAVYLLLAVSLSSVLIVVATVAIRLLLWVVTT